MSRLHLHTTGFLSLQRSQAFSTGYYSLDGSTLYHRLYASLLASDGHCTPSRCIMPVVTYVTVFFLWWCPCQAQWPSQPHHVMVHDIAIFQIAKYYKHPQISPEEPSRWPDHPFSCTRLSHSFHQVLALDPFPPFSPFPQPPFIPPLVPPSSCHHALLTITPIHQTPVNIKHPKICADRPIQPPVLPLSHSWFTCGFHPIFNPPSSLP